MHAISVKVRARERVSRYTRGNPSFYKLRVHQPAYSVARRLPDQPASWPSPRLCTGQSVGRPLIGRSIARSLERSVGRSVGRSHAGSFARPPVCPAATPFSRPVDQTAKREREKSLAHRVRAKRSEPCRGCIASRCNYRAHPQDEPAFSLSATRRMRNLRARLASLRLYSPLLASTRLYPPLLASTRLYSPVLAASHAPPSAVRSRPLTRAPNHRSSSRRRSNRVSLSFRSESRRSQTPSMLALRQRGERERETASRRSR